MTTHERLMEFQPGFGRTVHWININVAVEVVGGSTRVGHSICIRAFVHVGHTRSLSVHVAHYHMMCAYVTERGTISYYIMCMKGDPVLSV